MAAGDCLHTYNNPSPICMQDRFNKYKSTYCVLTNVSE